MIGDYILALIIIAPSILFGLAMIDNMYLTNKNLELTQQLEIERHGNNLRTILCGSRPTSTYNKNGREVL